MGSIKRMISMLLAIVLVISFCPVCTHASAETANSTNTTFSVETVSSMPGSTVKVDICIAGNPGVLGATLKVTYADGLTLVDAAAGEAFAALDMTKPGKYVSGCNFVWDAQDITREDILDGVILTLTFDVAEDVDVNQTLAVGISADADDIFNTDFQDIPFTMTDGGVLIIDYLPGDVNNDGVINTKDIVFLRRYLAGGYDQTIKEAAADVNDDGKLNSKDAVLIRRYIAGGYGIELLPSSPKCAHTMVHTEYQAATCTEDGHISYYHCSNCNKYYADANGNTEITLSSTVLAATGHTAVTDPYVEPTYDSVGWTEGSHCSTCGEVLIAQEEIPMLEKNEYYIYYHIAGSDTYLMELESSGNLINENPATYTDGDSITLLNLSVPGFVFEGWYDGEGSSAEQIKKIENRTGTVHLYAHWTVVTYRVSFESDLIPVDAMTYSVNQETALPVPKLDGYIFAGWSDGSGNIIKRIPTGQIGHKTYTANWLSERNQAWTKTKLDEPLIYEEDDVILFIYEIGEIRNVPLYVIKDFGKINSSGVSQTVTTTYSTSISTELMESYTKNVAKATTDSFAWTLSSDWSQSTNVSEEWAEENGMTVEEAQSVCTNESSNWYVSSGKSGTDTTVDLNTKDSYDLTTTTENTKTYDTTDESTRQDFSAGLEVDYTRSTTVEASAKMGDIGGSASTTSEIGVGVDLKYANGKTTSKKTGTEGDEGSSDQDGSISHTGTTTTNSSSWNNESGYGGSASISNNSSISNSVSQLISNKYGYGQEYVESGGESNTQGYSASASSSDEYSSTVTYATTTEETITTTYETSNTMSGYHRWVVAGTAHVFGIVGYDIASEAYFVYTYSVMDDETHPFEDYSYEYASYDDNQNSVISFEIPAEAGDYVADRVGQSDGLEVSKDGIITAYTGTDDFVIIPEYKVIKNLDGTATVIKVTGVSANAFRGNENLVGIELSDYITEIPDYAFENCAALKSFEGRAVTKVGRNAFAGCTTLKACALGDSVVSLGANAFDGLDSFAIHASNASVVDTALQSGAKEITVGVSDKCNALSNMTLTVPDTTDRFTFQGYGREYTDLYIVSNASKTGIYRAKFTSTGKTPLQLSSELIILQEVTATAPGIALICSAEASDVYLYGESYVTSAYENAMLSKTVTLQQLKNDYYSQLHITDGNYLVCGEVGGSNYLSVENGEIISIDEEAFEKYAKGLINISFDANGGEVSRTSMTAYYGSVVGEMPTPTRTGYTFVGWFTEDDEQITSDSVLTTTGNITLYAKWSALAYSLSWSNGTGYSISVNRTNSPYAGAFTGSLSNGATIYYGDVLSISYTRADYYTITSHGATTITVTGNVTPSHIYATAQLNEVSGWVKESEMPSGAQVINQKWSYTKTTTTESTATSMDGYTQIGSYWVKSGTGSQNYSTEFPGGFDTGHWIYTSFAKSAVSAYENATNKREVSNSWSGYVYWHWMYNTDSANGTSTRAIWNQYGTCSVNGFKYQYFGAFTSTNGNYSGSNTYCNNLGIYNYIIPERTAYADCQGATRWFRFEYYTSYYTDYYKMFQYQKVENLESTTEVTASDTISNVQKWVQYRAK